MKWLLPLLIIFCSYAAADHHEWEYCELVAQLQGGGFTVNGTVENSSQDSFMATIDRLTEQGMTLDGTPLRIIRTVFIVITDSHNKVTGAISFGDAAPVGLGPAGQIFYEGTGCIFNPVILENG